MDVSEQVGRRSMGVEEAAMQELSALSRERRDHGPIRAAYEEQIDLLDRLDKVLTELELDVEPVLSADHEGEMPTMGPGEPEDRRSQLASVTAQHNRRLRRIISRVESVIARVEL